MTAPPFLSNPDVVIIGGGFYGCAIALYLKTHWRIPHVMVLEQSDGLLGRASLHNQARVHNGYHYPRSFVTAHRSRVNFPRFVGDYTDAVRRDFTKLYAKARRNSQISARQFMRFCHEIGAPVQAAPPALHRLFAPNLIEQVFLSEEYAFDAVILAQKLSHDLHQAGVEVRYHHRVADIVAGPEGTLRILPFDITAPMIFNCTYAGLAQVTSLGRPLKYELAEIALIRPPPMLQDLGITVMDGPFFSIMPFPAAGLHSLTHVLYTPHIHCHTFADADLAYAQTPQKSHCDMMIRDAGRYVPSIAQAEYGKSLFEIKVVLTANELDDGRPILIEHHPHFRGLISILGGKIDNIYDVFNALDEVLSHR